jgi:hypothetical protein
MLTTPNKTLKLARMPLSVVNMLQVGLAVVTNGVRRLQQKSVCVFAIITSTLLKVLITASHGAHTCSVTCSVLLLIQHFIFQKFCGYRFYYLMYFYFRGFPVEVSGGLRKHF